MELTDRKTLIAALRLYDERGTWPRSSWITLLMKLGWLRLSPGLQVTQAGRDVLGPPPAPLPVERKSKWEPCSCCPPREPRVACRLTAGRISNSLIINTRKWRRR